MNYISAVGSYTYQSIGDQICCLRSCQVKERARLEQFLDGTSAVFVTLIDTTTIKLIISRREWKGFLSSLERPFKQSIDPILIGGGSNHVLAGHSYGDMDSLVLVHPLMASQYFENLRVDGTNILVQFMSFNLKKIERVILNFLSRIALNQGYCPVKSFTATIDTSDDGTSVVYRFEKIDIGLKNIFAFTESLKNQQPISHSPSNGWWLFMNSKQVTNIDQITFCSTPQDLEMKFKMLRAKKFPITNPDIIRKNLPLHLILAMIKGFNIEPELLDSLKQRIIDEYNLHPGEQNPYKQSLSNFCMKFYTAHYSDNDSGFVTKSRLILFLSLLGILKDREPVCAELARSFVPCETEEWAKENYNPILFIKCFPEMTEHLLNVIYGFSFKSNMVLNDLYLPFLCGNRKYYLRSYRKDISTVKCGIQTWESFNEIEKLISSNRNARLYLANLFHCLCLGNMNMSKQRVLFIEKLMNRFDERKERNKGRLFYSGLKQDPSFTSLRIVETKLLQWDLKDQIEALSLSSQNRKELSECFDCLLFLLSQKDISKLDDLNFSLRLECLNSILINLFQNRHFASSEELFLILNALTDLIDNKNPDFTHKMCLLYEKRITDCQNVDNPKLQLLLRLIIAVSQLNKEELNRTAVNLLSQCEQSDPIFFGQLMRSENVHIPLQKIAFFLCENFQENERLIIYLLKKIANSSHHFFELLHTVFILLSSHYPSSCKQLAELMDALQEKRICIENSGFKRSLFSFSFTLLFLDSEAPCTVLTCLTADMGPYDRVKVYEDFIRFLCEKFHPIFYKNEEAFAIFTRAIRILDPSQDYFSLTRSLKTGDVLDCLNGAITKIDPCLLQIHPFSLLSVIRQRIITTQLKRMSNQFKRISMSFISAVDENRPYLLADPSSARFIALINKRSFKNVLKKENALMTAFFHRLMMNASLCNLNFIERLSQSSLEVGIITSHVKNDIDFFLSQKYYERAKQGLTNAFNCFISKISQKIHINNHKKFEWMYLKNAFEEYFIKKAIFYRVKEPLRSQMGNLFSPLVRIVDRQRYNVVLDKFKRSFHPVFCHSIMHSPEKHSSEAFINILNGYAEYSKYTPFIRSQIKQVYTYIHYRYASEGVDKALYKALVDLSYKMFLDPTCENLAEEVNHYIPTVRGVIDEEMKFIMHLRFKCWTTFLINKNCFKEVVRVTQIAQKEMQNKDDIKAYYISFLHLLQIDSIALGIKEKTLNLRHPFLELNICILEDFRQDLYVCEDLDALACISKRLENITPSIIVYAPDLLSRLISVYACFSEVFFQTALSNMDIKLYTDFASEHYFPFVESIAGKANIISLVGVTIVNAFQATIFPILLENVFPLHLVRPEQGASFTGTQLASHKRIKLMAKEKPDLVLSIIKERNPSALCLKADNPFMGFIIKESLKFISSQSDQNLEKLISLGPLEAEVSAVKRQIRQTLDTMKLNKANGISCKVSIIQVCQGIVQPIPVKKSNNSSMDGASTADNLCKVLENEHKKSRVDSIKITSIRHIGFSLSIYILECNMKLFKNEFPPREIIRLQLLIDCMKYSFPYLFCEKAFNQLKSKLVLHEKSFEKFKEDLAQVENSKEKLEVKDVEKEKTI